MTTPLIATFCLGCCAGMIYTLLISRAIERKHRKKDELAAPGRKRLVYGTQKTLDREIERWRTKGWRLCMTQTNYWMKGRKVYIAELENKPE